MSITVARDSVFISYRRGDAAAQAGRLASELKRSFGEDWVFFDTEDIGAGQRFPERIRHALARARVVLVVLGEGWLRAVDEHGRRRIDDHEDWVHQEVAGALDTEGVTVIPVLIDAARMPPPTAFPPVLALLADCQPLRLEHGQFALHAEQIRGHLRDLGIEERTHARPALRVPTEPRRYGQFGAEIPHAGRGGPQPTGVHHYEPYPTEQVQKLEELTRARDTGTPIEKIQRQAEITQLANQLARNPMVGDVVAGARLVARSGKGNYGTVWHATDVETGEARAVKIFDTDRLGLSQSLYHFRRGVRAMRHLTAIDGRPPSVVRLHQAEPSDLAFSMDYLDGGDLTRVADRGWALEKKLELMSTLCRAVEFAHRHQVIHRDIKPANIVMFGADPVLTDFDIADLLFAKTQSAQASGSVHYSAPEALAGGGGHGPRVDVFSLGRLLHFLLLERDPLLTFEEIPQLNDISAEHPALARIVRRCTLRKPDDRYPTVAQIYEDLERCRHGNEQVGVELVFPSSPQVTEHHKHPEPPPYPSRQVGVEPSLPPTTRTRAPRPPAVAAGTITAAGAVLAALIVGGAALYNGQNPSAPAELAQPNAGSARSRAPTATESSSMAPTAHLAEPPSPSPEGVDAKLGIEFVPIPGGTFLMGSPAGQGDDNEHPQHRVTVSAFELGKYSVTNEQYRRFLEANPSIDKPPGWTDSRLIAQRPVVNVNWRDAQTFATWAGFRLPTEAEREYATRAGTQTHYWSGDTEADLGRVGWFSDNTKSLHDVGEKPANPFGLYDVHGHVWEWCSDRFGPYAAGAVVDPTGAAGGAYRVLRGGSWLGSAPAARSACRDYRPPDVRNVYIGFRLARGSQTGK